LALAKRFFSSRNLDFGQFFMLSYSGLALSEHRFQFRDRRLQRGNPPFPLQQPFVALGKLLGESLRPCREQQ